MDNSVMDNTAGINQQPQAIENGQAPEKMLPQSTVNELIGSVRREGREAAQKAAKEAVEEYRKTQDSSTRPNESYTNQSKSLSEDDIARVAGDVLSKQKDQWEREAQEKAYSEAANRIVNAYNSKIAQGREKYQDFDAVTSNLDMGRYPNDVQLLADYVDNSSDVLYELAKNRTKLKLIENLGEDDAQSAVHEIKRLSDSLKSNEAASQVKLAKQPLSQPRPSDTGTDSGQLSMADLKRKYSTAKNYR